MDIQRFVTSVKTVKTRRATLGLVAGLSALLGDLGQEAAAGKCKSNRKCGRCKRCKKGRCTWRRGAPRCGPCSYCEGGACRQLCPPEDCITDGGQEVCLRDCAPPCDTCSVCNRETGECDPICASEICVDGVCQSL